MRLLSPTLHFPIMLLHVLRLLAILWRILAEDLGLCAILRTFLLLTAAAGVIARLLSALGRRAAGALASRRRWRTRVLFVGGGVGALGLRVLALWVAGAGAVVLGCEAQAGSGEGALGAERGGREAAEGEGAEIRHGDGCCYGFLG